MILAIDPGPEMSAWITIDDSGHLFEFGKRDNESLLGIVKKWAAWSNDDDHVVIEMIASYGMPVGAEVFETCVWIGRFIEAAQGAERVYRKDVKMHLCGTTRANDATIRRALIDRYGPGKEKAIGTKKAPGPLYGVSGDVWAALAVAVTFNDKRG